MLEYNKFSKGLTMEIMPYRLPDEMYQSINRKINQIIYEVSQELKKEFSTKIDLELAQAKIQKQIAEFELRLKEDLSGIKIDVMGARTKVEELSKDLDDKIKGFKYSIIWWIIGGSLFIVLGQNISFLASLFH